MSENETPAAERPTLPAPPDADPSGDRPSEQPAAEAAPEQPADGAGAPKRGRGRPRTVTFGKVCRLVTKLDDAAEGVPTESDLSFAGIRADEIAFGTYGKIQAGEYLLVPVVLEDGKPGHRYSIVHLALANRVGLYL